MLPTYILTITLVLSLLAWWQPGIATSLAAHPYRSYHHGQWHRCLTQGLFYRHPLHFLLDALAFYLFGMRVAMVYHHGLSWWGIPAFLGLYLGGVVVGGLLDTLRWREMEALQAAGASAGVAAVMMGDLFYHPAGQLTVLGLTLPAWLMLPLYVGLSYQLAQRRHGHANPWAYLGAMLWAIVHALLLHVSSLAYQLPLLS